MTDETMVLGKKFANATFLREMIGFAAGRLMELEVGELARARLMLRHLILMDAKSATYKLGLLRSLCRAVDGSAGLGEGDGGEHVRLPLLSAALNRLRLCAVGRSGGCGHPSPEPGRRLLDHAGTP
ncbi:hypothetical protein QMO56_09190 [Roseomonas sp. E05]|nr:hypothetical protein [Roseomonas sp. E05]MDJ0388287.1 hypothetical protein [Roseomonas sp. E05]